MSPEEQELIAAREAGRAAAANGQLADANPYQPATTTREGCLQMSWAVAWQQEAEQAQTDMTNQQDNTALTADAIRTVLDPEYFGTGGARALAGVLLHCYNAQDYALDITELGRMDSRLQAMAWGVMRLRVDGVEPHQVIDDRAQFDRVVEIYGSVEQ